MTHENLPPDLAAERTSPAGGLPIAPSLSPELQTVSIRPRLYLADSRTVLISGLAIFLGMQSAIVSRLLIKLIQLVTNLSFFGRFSTSMTSPADNHLGVIVVLVPAVGGLLVGLMARYGSAAIRGHGIPEAMEQILKNKSRIPARLTFLKPLSAAISIGTGGPFGAEGPIIATGGALGSLLGQIFPTDDAERKTLLAAGAAAGMTATFGSPIAGILLAVELLLFEFKARSLIPVALACATAAAIRLSRLGPNPVFSMPAGIQVTPFGVVVCAAIGAAIGLLSIYVTKLVYGIEDLFDRLPIHWMWWPIIGGFVVGIIGLFAPHTLGVGYDNIDHFLDGTLTGRVMVMFCLLKWISWSISLGSGTSGGTLAPLFTIGGGAGAAIALAANAALHFQAVDPAMAALVGMAAMFAGASRAFLTSLVFAFEVTHRQAALLPLLAGCTSAYLLSSLLMKNTIMTEKIVRRGIHVPAEYSAHPAA